MIAPAATTTHTTHPTTQVYYTDPNFPVQPIYILVVALGMLVAFALRKLEIKHVDTGGPRIATVTAGCNGRVTGA